MAPKAPIRRKIIRCDKVCPTVLPLNAAVQVDNTLYISGQLGTNVKGELAATFEDQARQCLQNIGHVLNSAGANYSNVVKATVLLSDIKNFPTMNKVYGEFFKSNFPARVAYQVAHLPLGGLIEIEAIAAIGEIEEVQ